MFLACDLAARRGARIDWLIGALILIGIPLLMWNSSVGFFQNFPHLFQVGLNISTTEDLQILVCGAFALISFGGYCLSLRKATFNSGVMKVFFFPEI